MTSQLSINKIKKILIGGGKFTEDSPVYKDIPETYLSDKAFADEILSLNPNAIYIFSNSIRSDYDFMLSLFSKTRVDFSTESMQRVQSIPLELRQDADFVCELLAGNGHSYMTVFAPFVDKLVSTYKEKYNYTFIEDFPEIRNTDLYKDLYKCGIALTRHARKLEVDIVQTWTIGYSVITDTPALATDKHFIKEILENNWRNFKAIPHKKYYEQYSDLEFISPWKDGSVLHLLENPDLKMTQWEAKEIIENLSDSTLSDNKSLKYLLRRYPLSADSVRLEQIERDPTTGSKIDLSVVQKESANFFTSVFKRMIKTIDGKTELEKHKELLEYVILRADHSKLKDPALLKTLKLDIRDIIADVLFRYSVITLQKAPDGANSKRTPLKRKTLSP